MIRDRLLVASVIVVWVAVIVVGLVFLGPITSQITSHDGPQYQLEQP